MKVVFVTKPLAPPWNDSGKNMPRDLARALAGRHDLHVLTTAGGLEGWPAGVTPHAVYGGTGTYRPGPVQHVRMMAGVWGLRDRFDLMHFFFQPHPAACATARMLARACGRRSVHTAMSAPAPDAHVARLAFADRTVVLSSDTARRYERAGLTPPAVVPPALGDTRPASEARRERARTAYGLEGEFVVYPGDYEFSGGHELLLDVWSARPGLPMLVATGRAKTPRAAERRSAFERAAADRGLGERVRFLGTLEDPPALLAASAAVVFPAVSVYGKTDVPLVLLEAWRESRPVLVSDLAPLAEAVEGAGAVLPRDPVAWGAALEALRDRAGEWGESGRRRLTERHSIDAMADAYDAIYRAAAARDGRSERRAS